MMVTSCHGFVYFVSTLFPGSEGNNTSKGETWLQSWTALKSQTANFHPSLLKTAFIRVLLNVCVLLTPWVPGK